MSNEITFLIAGGDLRQIYAAKALAREFKVYAAGFDKNVVDFSGIEHIENINDIKERVDYIVLPLPASNDGVFVNTPFSKQNIPLTSLTSMLKDGGTVFGGKFDARTLRIFNKFGVDTVDYFEREELNVLNAVPTAEGAVQIAMEEMASTIYGRRILITGMGRISKVLVKILQGMSADVTVAARKYSDLSWAEIYGCRTVHTSELAESIENYELIFNTVPALLFDDKILKRADRDVLIIDLSSKPGGVDFEAAGGIGLKVVWALSLPGKVAPISAGEIIALTVLNILKERGGADD